MAEAAPAEAAAPADLIVEDNATDLSSGQMRQSEFLEALRSAVCAATGPVLAAAGRSIEGCPYLDYWFTYFGEKDAAYVESTLRRYAPEAAGAAAAADYIPIVAERVRQGVERWTRTGEIVGVPEGLPTALPGETPAPGGGAAGGRHLKAIRFKARAGGAKRAANPHTLEQRLGDGSALPGPVRSRMESAFGTDFSQVRVHTNGGATAQADRLNARAFTLGQHVAFGTGEYQPGTPLGDALLAHELAHVLQQRDAETSAVAGEMDANVSVASGLEADADRSALSAVAALWQGGKDALAGIGRNALPRLRSGLRLARCSRDGGAPAAAGVKPKLSKKTVKGPNPVDCGGFEWVIQWVLDNPSPAGGWVVQHVDFNFNVTDCKDVALDPKKTYGMSNISFWEAWEVHKNQKVTTYAEGGDVNDDTFGAPPGGKDTKGNITINGLADFYEGLALPKSFTVTNKPPAWILPMTTADPGLKGGSGAISHTLKAEWDCCPPSKDKSTKITTT
jgi:hypothetical protein